MSEIVGGLIVILIFLGAMILIYCLVLVIKLMRRGIVALDKYIDKNSLK